MFDKYKYHQKVLVYLNDKRSEHLNQMELNKTSQTKMYGFTNDYASAEEISNSLKIDSERIKKTLVDLNELGFIDSKSFRYHSKENTSIYIDSRYFNTKRNEYIEKKVIDSVKNAIIIIIGLTSIYTFFFVAQMGNNKSIEKEMSEIKSELDSIKVEQQSIQRRFLNDTLN